MSDSSPKVSVIICTHNRAASLEATLRALEGVAVPSGWNAELIVVDNASTDDTALVLQNARLPNFAVRCLREPKKGVSHAHNKGLGAASGEVILFTDDDVAPANDWLERMATPLFERQCDAVVGRIEIAAHLRRPWMEPVHKCWLAATEAASAGKLELIGASMGIQRSVLRQVPAFDPELGPGALGFGDDTLLSDQLAEAGLRIQFVDSAVVVHRFLPSRLHRAAWLDAARMRGRSHAYLMHHWHHGSLSFPRLRWLWFGTRLCCKRIIRPPCSAQDEGCPKWELGYVEAMANCSQILRERCRPRNYTFHGLVKLNAHTEAEG
jgi:glycosyltransferase involved in cell wall biosynthesis